jgi:hypothetical protein
MFSLKLDGGRGQYVNSYSSMLIIQGPIESVGRTGKSLHNPNGGIGLDSIVRFDSSATINEYISNYSTLFDLIVVSTWDSEDTSRLISSKNLHIIKSQDNLRSLHPNSAHSGYSGNNKYRQFYSMKAGLEYGETKGIQFAIKVRSDNSVNAACLLDSVFQNPDHIWFPKIGDRKNYLEDFYIGGSVRNLMTMCDSMLNQRALHRSVHYDLFYKSVQVLEERNLRNVFDFFPRTHVWTVSQANLISRANSDFLSYFPLEAWNNQIWRGEMIENQFRIPADQIPLSTAIPVTTKLSCTSFDIRAFSYFILGDALGVPVIQILSSIRFLASKIRAHLVRLVRRVPWL